MLLHHPDKQAPAPGNGFEVKAEQQQRDRGQSVDIRLINEAKWILSDAGRRKDWEERFYSSGRSTMPPVD